MRPTGTAAALALGAALVLGMAAMTGAAPGKKPGRKPAAPAAAQGKKVYESAGCAGCHAIAGKGAKGGPDLTHVGKSRKPAWIQTQIRSPRKNTPSSTMPAYGKDRLNDKDLKALVAYLSALK